MDEYELYEDMWNMWRYQTICDASSIVMLEYNEVFQSAGTQVLQCIQ